MTKDEALKLALEILKAAYVPADLDEQREKAITAIKEALAQPEQEPVAWQDTAKHTEIVAAEEWENIDPMWHWMYRPLYTAPPAAQRQPLTNDQIKVIEQGIWKPEFFDDTERQANREFARAIETAHGIGENT